MKRFLKISAMALAAMCLLNACNKPEAPVETASCCQKPAEETTALSAKTENSIYQLPGDFTNADGQKTELKNFQGKIRLVAMIFTHCGYACPRMVSNLKHIEENLPAGVKNDLGFVLVSFDAERDNPARLKQYAAANGLGKEWTLLHGDATQVRTLSMLLNVQYNQLADGSFNHSNILTILDKNGNIVQQLEGLDIDIKNVTKIVGELAAQ